MTSFYSLSRGGGDETMAASDGRRPNPEHFELLFCAAGSVPGKLQLIMRVSCAFGCWWMSVLAFSVPSVLPGLACS